MVPRSTNSSFIHVRQNFQPCKSFIYIYIYLSCNFLELTLLYLIAKSDDLVTYYIYIQVLSQANVLVGIKFTKWHKKLNYLNFVKNFNTFYLKM